MEVVEMNSKRREELPCRTAGMCPCNLKCTRKYVQPPRMKSFAPEMIYKPPTKPLEASTTYHLSYLNLDRAEMRRSRSQPIRPSPALEKSTGKLADETTNKLSYKPVWNIVKVKPFLPKHRSMTSSGIMENLTTARRDFVAKHVERPDIIVPQGNIRISTGHLEGRTTAMLSYMPPEPSEPTMNFKPVRTYCPPTEPIPDVTTQKLSYQPFCVQEKEFHPWKQKATYKPPDIAMCGKTTYLESYLKNEETCMEKPIIPTATNILPYGAEFAGKTVYKESYLPCEFDRVVPYRPSHSISKPSGKISADTTSKLSYQAVQTEKRAPIVPHCRNMMGDGPMQSETTNRCDFVPKATLRPEPVVPSNNLRSADAPMDDGTTTKLSYMKHEHVELAKSFKPIAQYCRSAEKIDTDSVSKLSYQPWAPIIKEKMPWASKKKYEPPTAPMSGDTVYHSSYPEPGYYVEDTCLSPRCDCLDEKNGRA